MPASSPCLCPSIYSETIASPRRCLVAQSSAKFLLASNASVMEASDPNSALLGHPSRTESPEPLSAAAIPRPSNRPGRPRSTGHYAYSTISAVPRSPSPPRNDHSATGDAASYLAVPGSPGPAIDPLSVPNQGQNATPEDVGDALTVSIPNPSKPVDVIIHSFQHDVATGPGTHVRTLDDLKAFLEKDPTSQSPGTDYLLLVEDIPNHAVEYMADVLDFNPKTALEHVKGRVNDWRDKSRSDLHVNKLRSTLFDHISRRENQESLTWWRLFSHSRKGYTREKEALDKAAADTRKITVPHFEVHISDTFRKSPSDDIELGAKGLGALVKSQWQKKQKEMGHRRKTKQPQLPSSLNDTTPDPTTTSQPTELRSREVFKLDSVTYRAHQVVTEVDDDVWGAAAEERITFSRIRRDGSNYCRYSV